MYQNVRPLEKSKNNPGEEWIPLQFMIARVYPLIKHSIWTVQDDESYVAFHEHFETTMKKLGIRGKARGAYCLLKSIQSFLIPLLAKLEHDGQHMVCHILSVVVGGALTAKEIEKIFLHGGIDYRDGHLRSNTSGKNVDSAPCTFYYYEYLLGDDGDNGGDSDLFLNQCHLLILLCSYLLVLKVESEEMDEKHLFIFADLLEMLCEYVCCWNPSWSFNTEEDIYEDILKANTNEYWKQPFQCRMKALMKDTTLKENSWNSLSQSLVYVLGLHHQYFDLAVEAPIALFRVNPTWGVNSTQNGVEFEFNRFIHPITIIQEKRMNKNGETVKRVTEYETGRLNLKYNENEYDTDETRGMRDYPVLIPQIVLRNDRDIRKALKYEKMFQKSPLSRNKTLDYDYFDHLKTIVRVSELIDGESEK